MSRDINSKLGDAREGIFQLHHEDTDRFEKTFGLETSAVIEVFKSIGNRKFFIHITTKHMLDNEASNSVRIGEKIWRKPYNTFLENKLHNTSASVCDSIPKNNLPCSLRKTHLNLNQSSH